MYSINLLKILIILRLESSPVHISSYNFFSTIYNLTKSKFGTYVNLKLIVKNY